MIDQDLLGQMQSALLEPVDGGASWTSALWTRDEVLGAASEGQAAILKDTLCVVTSASVDVGGNEPKVFLPADCVRIVGVRWRGIDGTQRDLDRSSSFEVDHLLPTWQTVSQAAPLVYLEYERETLTLQIAPTLSGPILPVVAGTLDLDYVPAGTPLTGNGVALTVPDELAHAVKYGALADLLSKDGRAQDTTRAQYCADRVHLAVDLTRLLLEGWS